MTNAEVILWSRLRRKSFAGLRFRRQHPIGPFVADFACVAAHAVIEVDGGTHGTDEEVDYDRRRDALLRAEGWHVLRIRNEDIYRRLDDVMEGIGNWLPPPPASRAPPP